MNHSCKGLDYSPHRHAFLKYRNTRFLSMIIYHFINMRVTNIGNKFKKMYSRKYLNFFIRSIAIKVIWDKTHHRQYIFLKREVNIIFWQNWKSLLS